MDLEVWKLWTWEDWKLWTWRYKNYGLKGMDIMDLEVWKLWT